MKRLVYISIILALFSCKDSQKTRKQTIHVNDTTYLLRVIYGDDTPEYRTVYIERDRNSEYHKQLADFSFNEYDSSNFTWMYKNIGATVGSPLKKIDLKELRGEWVPLYKYRGVYYVYGPGRKIGRIILSDSLLYFWNMEGVNPFQLISFTQTAKDVFNIKTYFPKWANSYYSDMDIYVIDSSKKITLWHSNSDKEERMDNRQRYYQYMIPKDSIKNYDMVVDLSTFEIDEDFEFDYIDYRSFIKEKSDSKLH